MPNTPQVKFNFKNNNVQPSVPLLGVSHVIARTTKGPFNDPSTLLNSYTQFQRIFGEEIVPDGTVSNIRKAFDLGSKIRVSRVAGVQGAQYGWAKIFETSNPNQGAASKGEAVKFQIFLTNPRDDTQYFGFNFKIRTKEAGSPVIDNTGYNLNRPFYLNISNTTTAKTTWNLVQYGAMITSTSENDKVDPDSVLASIPIISGSKKDMSLSFTDVNVFRNFVNQVTNIELILDDDATHKGVETPAGSDLAPLAERVHTMDAALSLMESYSNWVPKVKIGTFTITDQEISSSTILKDRNLTIQEGTDGGDPSSDSVIEAYNALKDYQDGYQLILSHAWNWPFKKLQAAEEEEGEEEVVDRSGYETALTAIAEDVKKNFEIVLYIEVPKYSEAGDYTPMTLDGATAYLKRIQGMVGYAKNIAYFGGGLKYYNDQESLQDCDVLGSVIGLGDTAASLYGPWYSFAGMNRGILADAQGPVMENFGSPSKVESLQTLAEWYCNIMVMKNTPTQGLRTMLWHCFSSNPKNDSEKFLSIVRLNLYLKKNLRPILESYLEEPNTFSTWQDIYQEAKDRVLDPLVGEAMTEYTWMGDQDASSYEDLQVNTEADVRQGKYHVVLKYSDIVPLQEVTIDIMIDAASRTISIDTEE